jgi:hypothetical protein
MSTNSAISILLVFIGAAFIVAALLAARVTWSRVPASLRANWLAISYLMVFFVGGYLVFDVVLFFRIPIPVELVTAVVFFAGAVFVFIITRLASRTIVDMSAAELRLVAMNDGLEQRVTDRTRELKKSHDFSKTVLNSMGTRSRSWGSRTSGSTASTRCSWRSSGSRRGRPSGGAATPSPTAARSPARRRTTPARSSRPRPPASRLRRSTSITVRTAR